MLIETRWLSAITGLLLMVLSANLPVQAAVSEVKLGVGDAAPALSVAKWYKGTPLPAFEHGQVYVVEFWATWCGPCKASMPHLTELQKQYAGKVTFIGVDVLENPANATDDSIAKLAKAFVESMGDKIGYAVAGDGTEKFMATHWLQAAGQTGIPASFVILGDGNIGWIGHPDGLAKVLPDVVAGTWDVAAERKRVDSLADAMKPHNVARAKIIPLYRAKDWAGVIAARDEAVANSPELAKVSDIVSYGIEAMFDSDPQRAIGYIKELYSPDGPVSSNAVSNWDIFRVLPKVSNTSPMTATDWKQVAAIIGPSISKTTKKGYGNFTGYADILWRAGDPAQAKSFQEKGVSILAAWNEAHKDTLVKGNIDILDQQQARLKAMTAGLPYVASTQPANSSD